MNKRKKGKFGEELARSFLKNQGIEIIKKNYFTKYGEIDLIGIEKETIIFIEVKFRNSKHFGDPIESIDKKKKMRMIRSAKAAINENSQLRCFEYKIRGSRHTLNIQFPSRYPVANESTSHTTFS